MAAAVRAAGLSIARRRRRVMKKTLQRCVARAGRAAHAVRLAARRRHLAGADAHQQPRRGSSRPSGWTSPTTSTSARTTSIDASGGLTIGEGVQIIHPLRARCPQLSHRALRLAGPRLLGPAATAPGLRAPRRAQIGRLRLHRPAQRRRRRAARIGRGVVVRAVQLRAPARCPTSPSSPASPARWSAIPATPTTPVRRHPDARRLRRVGRAHGGERPVTARPCPRCRPAASRHGPGRT
ncbi:MAG: hypothetical protein MZW92_58655 [Comamonadaceae bacterium]|nr:hypothetical protein [Comamonadaceae bacterium]